MEPTFKKFKTVDEYLSSLPKEVKALMQKIRETIKEAAPQAEELISYNMPSFNLEGRLVYYAAHTKHIGFYPLTSGIKAFKNELSVYKGAKGSVQFPFDKPLPLQLIAKIIKFRVEENLAKAELKKNKKRNSKYQK